MECECAWEKHAVDVPLAGAFTTTQLFCCFFKHVFVVLQRLTFMQL